MAKASDQDGFDSEGRKLGEQNGLDRSFAKRLDQKRAMWDMKSHGMTHSCFCQKYTAVRYVIMGKKILKTRVVLAVNAASQVLHILRECAVSQ